MIDLFKPTPRFEDGFLCNLVLNLRGATANCHSFDFSINSLRFTFRSQNSEFTLYKQNSASVTTWSWLRIDYSVIATAALARCDLESDTENASYLPGDPNFQGPDSEDETSVQEFQDAQSQSRPSVLGNSYLNNKHSQYVSNHPSMVTQTRKKKAGGGSKSAKRDRQDEKAQRRQSKRKKSRSDDEASYSGSEAPDSEPEDYETKLKAMEKENKLLKAQKVAWASGTKASKSGKPSTAVAHRALVTETAKQVAFPRTAFVDKNTIRFVTKKVMDAMDIAEFEGLEGEDLEAAHANWLDVHEDTVRLAYNELRNYQQGRAKDLWTSTHNLMDVDVPTPEEVEMVAKRKGMGNKDPNSRRMRVVFGWYWDKFLPIISSHKRWSPAKRHYNCISTARPNNDPNQMLYVTPSDEAYAVLVWENYAPHWTWKEQLLVPVQAAADKDKGKEGKDKEAAKPKPAAKPTYRAPTDEELQDARSKPTYTTPDGGVAKWGGWKKTGRKRYRALMEEIKLSKGDPTAKSGTKPRKQFEFVQALEKAILGVIQQENQVKLNGRAAKRNPAANKDDDVDSDHEIEWD